MRVVVTGATGNVGTSVVRALADDPAVTSVLGLARRRPELGWAVRPRWRLPASARSIDWLAIATQKASS